MGVIERKQRDKQEMRQRILDAAKEIFLEKGYQQASIRNIAERIEYSPGTIYLYFKEKDEIFHELHEYGFQKLIESMQPLQYVMDPFERLKAMGRVYLEFARDNKDLYDLMFIMEGPMNLIHEKDKWDMGCLSFSHLQNVIRDCQATGRFQGKDVDYLAFNIWSTVHGMCALYCRQRLHVLENKDKDDLMKYGFLYLVDMLERL